MPGRTPEDAQKLKKKQKMKAKSKPKKEKENENMEKTSSFEQRFVQSKGLRLNC